MNANRGYTVMEHILNSLVRRLLYRYISARIDSKAFLIHIHTQSDTHLCARVCNAIEPLLSVY